MTLISKISALRKCARLKCTGPQIRIMSATAAGGISLSEVVRFLTSFAPLSLAESWDNVGLLVEPASPVPIKKVILTIDLTESVMKEAVDAGANMIIAYHPPIFQPLKQITGGKWKERIVATCLEHKMAVFSPHTTWDAVKGGLSDWLASPFEFEDVEPLLPSRGQLVNPAYSHHLTVFCPSENVTQCNKLFGQNQAEVLSTSTVDLPTVGSSVKFLLNAKRPFLPELESALNETNCLYSIYERGPVPPKGCGTGRYGKLKTPIKLSEAVNSLKSFLGMPQIRIALEAGKSLESQVSSVAIVAGSGASVLRGVRADLYVTGEMLHHDLLDANHSNASVILINHSDSERGFLSQFAQRLSSHFSNHLTVLVSTADKDPITIV